MTAKKKATTKKSSARRTTAAKSSRTKSAGRKAAAKTSASKATGSRASSAKAASRTTRARASAPKANHAGRKPAPRAASAATNATRSPSRKRVSPVTEKDFKQFEDLLLAERARLLRELGHIENNVLNRSLRESSGELSGYSFHMADLGTDSMEREKALHFASAEGRALLDVNEALRRLYGGEYGTCENCGEPVGKARLEVVPHARLCVACKEQEERTQVGRYR